MRPVEKPIKTFPTTARQTTRSNCPERTPESIENHYRIERELADQLRHASRGERSHLYPQLYDELFRRVPDHPMLTRRADPVTRADQVRALLRLLKPFLWPESVFLEIGPGDCSLSLAVCNLVRRVYAVDVSTEITHGGDVPDNFSLVFSDGRSIPVPSSSVTIAFSNQLIEHLHPEDALEQAANVYRALSTGGVYICLTPNRMTGPHDVSKHFDDIATGLHLKEYTTAELVALLERAGFSNIKTIVRLKGMQVMVPAWAMTILEKIMGTLPRAIRKPVVRSRLAGALFGICVAAEK